MMVYTGYTGIYLYILVYNLKNNIGYIQAYTVTCDRNNFHAEAHHDFHDVCASYDTYPKHCMT